MSDFKEIFERVDSSIRIGRTDKAIEVLQAIESDQLSVNDRQKQQLLLGKGFVQKGKFLGVQEFLDQAKSTLLAFKKNELETSNGKTIDYYLTHAEYLIQTGNKESAFEEIETALVYAKANSKTPTIIMVLCSKSQAYISTNNFDDALKTTELAYQMMLEKGLEKQEDLLIEVFYQLSQIYIKKQDYESSLEYSKSLIEIAKRRNEVEKELVGLNNIAVFYAVQSDYKTAMRYFLDALEKGKEINHRPISAQCLINIGTIYGHLDNQLEAETRYLSALNEYEDVLNLNTRVIAFNNLGNAAMAREQFKAARKYFRNSLDLAKEAKYLQMQAHSAAQLARAYLSENKIEQSIPFATEAEELLKDLGDLNGRQINLINQGLIAFKQGNNDRAIILTSQGIAASKRMRDDSSEIRGYKVLAKIYHQQGDFEQALQYQLVYSSAQERYLRERRNRQVLDLEIKYAIRDKQTEIEQLRKENEYQSLLLKQNENISNKNAQLMQVNEELRQFAYVASHDLKEPLRMIGSYTQLIHRRHKEVFDEESTTFFNFVSEGVTRMNTLLEALLRYATIGKSEEDFEWIELKDAVELAVINLRVRVEETGAEISCGKLPKVHSIKSLLIQLFQNLIANAIKFRKKDTIPIINIDTEELEEEFVIRVSDNGIGIAPEFKERIFVIFQRLHTRVDYQGAGIGLSICLKIVQRLGGKIWVESEVGQGATFCITIPKPQQKSDLPSF